MGARGDCKRNAIIRGFSSAMRNIRLAEPAATAIVLMFSLHYQPAVGEKPNAYPLRTFNGTRNNVDNPDWGSVSSIQLRHRAGADYADTEFTPPGADRPSAREVMSEVFLPSTAFGSSRSALFVAWGQLVIMDISLTVDNTSEPFPVPCDDGGTDGLADVWCPSGVDSDPISFFRSTAGIQDGLRSPVNYATAFIDLDYVYGRTEEMALSLRVMEGGLMNMTDAGLPHLNPDGTWKVADQRTAEYPVTFALHVVLLLEHNRCCVEVAPDLGFSGDEDLYYACRRWTIASFEHITEEDFAIRLLRGVIFELGREQVAALEGSATSSATLNAIFGDGNDGSVYNAANDGTHVRARSLELDGETCYDTTVNSQADVFAITAGKAAFESALPPVVRVLNEGYEPADEDMMELHMARKDLVGVVMRNGISPIIRGAALSTAMGVDAHYPASISTSSLLFKLPVDAVQRGRDHGLPNYNDARAAYGLARATSFDDVTASVEVRELLEETYGGEIELLDAYTGALAEGSSNSTYGGFGELLIEAWVDQLYRTIIGDRLYHNHSEAIEDVELTTLSVLVQRAINITDMPVSAFVAPEITVFLDVWESGDNEVTLADGFKVAWEIRNDFLAITLSARSIGDQGMMAIGFGGTTMTSAQDYWICEVKSAGNAECIDRQPVSSREVPNADPGNSTLEVEYVSVGDWTKVTFLKDLNDVDAQDYDLMQDLDGDTETEVIYAFREGEGVDQHPNTNRGAHLINFKTGDGTEVCDENEDYYSLHGALMLLAWMLIAPVGIYFARYRKGEKCVMGREWYVLHAECMVVASEAVLPLGMTAIFTTGGGHETKHAKWGFFMIAAVAFQLLTGWLRTKALTGEHSNFAFGHRVNKHMHIWSGRFAYLAGAVQCYRGLGLVASEDTVLFDSPFTIQIELGHFGLVYKYIFPAWGAFLAALVIILETKKQFRRWNRKGGLNLCGCVEVVNSRFTPKEGEGGERIMPRTEDLPIYTMKEFNEKVLNGQSWVMIDGAIADVSGYSHTHPGGSRLILNAVGTDITHEILGRELSVGHVMSFSPHRHSAEAMDIVRGLVIGYIEEEDEEEEDTQETFDEGGRAAGVNVVSGGTLLPSRLATTVPSSSGAGGERSDGPVKSNSKRRLLLEQFHVCPLLFRELMSTNSDVSKRPVYKYVFSCPGMAAILVEAMTGACYFNLRATQEGGKGVVQRCYNSYAVRVPKSSAKETSGRGLLDRQGNTATPACETSEGELCIEMRIRHYEDGAMSKLLETLAKDTDNPAVQLQGPFVVDKVTPPPAHRNVIMIAAGTGINPIVSGEGTAKTREPSSMPLLEKGDVGAKEKKEEVSPKREQENRGERKAEEKVDIATAWAMAASVSPDGVTADPDNGIVSAVPVHKDTATTRGHMEAALIEERQTKENMAVASLDDQGVHNGQEKGDVDVISTDSSSKISDINHGSNRRVRGIDSPNDDIDVTTCSTGSGPEPAATANSRIPACNVNDDACHNTNISENENPGDKSNEALSSLRTVARRFLKLTFRGSFEDRPMMSTTPRRSSRMSLSSLVPVPPLELKSGKVTELVLRKVLGESLLSSIEDNGIKGAGSNRSLADRCTATERLEALCGTDTTPGEVQVIVSGPRGFVSYIEGLLRDIGVPAGAVVMLD